MKILFIGLKVGAGLISICNSVREQIKDLCQTEYVDIYSENESMAKYSSEGYYKLVKRIPSLVAFGQNIAYKSSLKAKNNHKYINKDVKASKVEVLKFIERYKPDLIYTPVCFVAMALDELIAEGKTEVKYIFQMPDFMVSYYTGNLRRHTYLLSSCKEVTDVLIERGVDKNTIYTVGVPISHKFYDNVDRQDILRELGYEGDKFILVSNGGAGFANNKKIVKAFYDKVGDYSFIVVNGKNTQSKEEIDRFIEENNVKKVINLGFVDYMPKLMKVADIMIGKCGSSSLCEAAASNVKYVALDNKLFPEIKNIKFLNKRKSAIVVKNLSGMKKALDMYINNPQDAQGIMNNFKQINVENGLEIIKDLMLGVQYQPPKIQSVNDGKTCLKKSKSPLLKRVMQQKV